MKLKLKSLISTSLIFCALLCFTTGTAFAVTKGATLNDGILTISNYTFGNADAATTTEYHGSFSYQQAKDYYEYDLTDSNNNYKPGKVTRPSLYFLNYGSMSNLYTDKRDIEDYSRIVEFRDRWTEWYIHNYNNLGIVDYYTANQRDVEVALTPIGYITDIPAGYYGRISSRQVVNNSTFTRLPLNGSSSQYVLNPHTLDGSIRSYTTSTVRMNDYNLYNPVTAVPTSISSIHVPTVGASANGIYFTGAIFTKSWSNQDYDTYVGYYTATRGTPQRNISSVNRATNAAQVSQTAYCTYTQLDVNRAQNAKNSGKVYVQASSTGGIDYNVYGVHSYSNAGYGYVKSVVKSRYGIAQFSPGGSLQLYHNYSSYTTPYTHVSYEPALTFTEAVVNNCFSESTLTATVPVEINGGQYKGSPALNSQNITVNKALITDNGGKTSTFMIGAESEQSVTKDGNTTITTVKLSNPPVYEIESGGGYPRQSIL